MEAQSRRAARCLEVRSVGRVPYGGNAQRGRDGGKLLSPVEADHGPRLLETSLRDLQVLVGDGELSFERV